MALLHEILTSNLPSKRRTTPMGWILFNAPCCSHMGHRPDTRMRGNLKINPDGEIGFNCFNCSFKFKYNGRSLSSNFEKFLGWIGADSQQIQAVKMALLKNKIDGVDPSVSNYSSVLSPWATVDLPALSQPLASLLDEDNLHFVQVGQYLQSRGKSIADGYDYYWSPSKDHLMHNRIILPFFYRDEIVGYTARYAGTPPPGVPKYWNSSIPQGFLFNNHVADIPQRRFLVVTEGPFDAIAVQGVAVMGSSLSEHQVHWLMNTDKKIVVLPDRQRQNQLLIDTALSFGWAVSFPDWEDNVKDGADACLKYGQIYTIGSVLRSQTTNPIEIGVKRKMFRG